MADRFSVRRRNHSPDQYLAALLEMKRMGGRRLSMDNVADYMAHTVDGMDLSQRGVGRTFHDVLLKERRINPCIGKWKRARSTCPDER